MNWQSLARRNGRTLAKGTTGVCAIFPNTLFPRCPRISNTSVGRWRHVRCLSHSGWSRRGSVNRMQYSRPWLIRRGFADSSEPLSISPTNQSNDGIHIDLVLSEELLSTMSLAADTVLRAPIRDRKRRARDDGRRKFSKLPSFSDSLGSKTRSQLLLKRQNEYKTNPRLKKMRDSRASLPMNQYRPAILDLINSNPYSIIVGATGSGKSTQVPQIILEDAVERGHGADVNILCTQPRRIAATSLARRVSSERNEDVGDTVGYVIRFDNKLPQSSGTITYCTIGALLARLRTEHDDLNSISHIILDEVHERSVENDFLMVALKKLLENRTKAGKKVPRLVIMSATLDDDLFLDYFGQMDADGVKKPCPIMTIPGRTFPVTSLYLGDIMSQLTGKYSESELNLVYSDQESNDYLRNEMKLKEGTGSTAQISLDVKSTRPVQEARPRQKPKDPDLLIPCGLIAATVAHITQSTQTGAILVFLPGWREICLVQAMLLESPLSVDFGDSTRFKVHLVHSDHPDGQADLFLPEPEGCRKIILATNIAETSITIPEVEHVVDSGKFRQNTYNHVRGTTELKCTWISKSNSKQRAGRAGRVQNGYYYALFPQSRFESLGKAVPDIHRADLHEICLSAKVRSPETSIKDYLAAAIEPPNHRALDKAIQSLRDMNALNKDEEITPLGNLLASLPLHPTIGRMVVLGIVFRCLDPLLILCAASSSKRLFVYPFGEESKAEAAHRNFDKGYNSDPVRFVEAFTSACRVQMQGKVEYEEFMRDHYLDTRAFETIQRVITQIKSLLINEGLLPRSSFAHHFPNLNENSGNFALIRALSIYRGNLACRDTAILFRTGRGDRTSIIMGAKSVNHPYQKGSQGEGKLGLPYHAIVSFGEMRRTDDGAFALENTTLISPIAAALFASDLELNPEGTTLTLDKWLRLTVKSGPGLPAEEDISTTILLFREAWDMILSSAFSQLSRRMPINHYKQQPFVDALVAVVSRDLGDEDMRRLVNGIAKEQERKTKMAKSTKLYDWQAMEKARVDRLESYLSEAY